MVGVQRSLEQPQRLAIRVAFVHGVHGVYGQAIGVVAFLRQQIDETVIASGGTGVFTRYVSIIGEAKDAGEGAVGEHRQRNGGLKTICEAALRGQLGDTAGVSAVVGRDGTAPEEAAAVAVGIHLLGRRGALAPVSAEERVCGRDSLHQTVDRFEDGERAFQIPSADALVETGEARGEGELTIVQEVEAGGLAFERGAQQAARFRYLCLSAVECARTVPRTDLELLAELSQ